MQSKTHRLLAGGGFVMVLYRSMWRLASVNPVEGKMPNYKPKFYAHLLLCDDSSAYFSSAYYFRQKYDLKTRRAILSQVVLTKDQSNLVDELLAQLPDLDQKLLRARHEELLSWAKIAQGQNLSPSGVRYRLRNAEFGLRTDDGRDQLRSVRESISSQIEAVVATLTVT